MRYIIAALFALVFTTALAGDLEDGVAAYDRKDYATALTKWRLVAQQGNRDAQTFIGAMYYEGKGVAQDYKEAMRWYKLASQQGEPLAQFSLGVMYYKGTGVVQDYVRAHMWFNIAAVGGDSDTAKKRDALASKLTPQQIEQAQKLARECQARNFKNCD